MNLSKLIGISFYLGNLLGTIPTFKITNCSQRCNLHMHSNKYMNQQSKQKYMPLRCRKKQIKSDTNYSNKITGELASAAHILK